MKMPQVFQCGIAGQLLWVRNLSTIILDFFFYFLFYMRLRLSQFFIL